MGIGRDPQRGSNLLAIPQNARTPKCPKIPQNAKERPKMLLYVPKCPEIPQNTPKRVLKDYRGVDQRARLPPKQEALPVGRARTNYGT